MCIAILALEAHDEFPFLLMHNRDEFFARPAEKLQRWAENPAWMAGRDLQSGGMWAVFTDGGDFGFITNYRDPSLHRDDRKSRGKILPEFLASGLAPEAFLTGLLGTVGEYNPFNLVLGRRGGETFYLNSLDAKLVPLASGIHAVSNARLETPWPKLRRARSLFEAALNTAPSRKTLVSKLFAALGDTRLGVKEELPQTGLSPERERMVSPIFVRSKDYGTVASLVALGDREGRLALTETTYGPDGAMSHNSLASALPRP